MKPKLWAVFFVLFLSIAFPATWATRLKADPLALGTLDTQAKENEEKARELVTDLGMDIAIDDSDIVRIGTGYTVAEGESVGGDVVIIGGGLTVNGTIKGDAVVIGGSMYLSSSAVVKGDAVVIGGILQQEPGAVVEGEIVENPEKLVERATSPRESKVRSTSEDIVKFGKDIHVKEGEVVDGDVVAIGGDIRIDGKVTGDVVATAGDIELGPTAEVLGDVVATFGEIEAEAGAQTEGDVVEIDMGGASQVIHEEEGTQEGMTYVISLYAPDAKDVRLTGNWLDWDPKGIKMEKNPKGVWKTTVSLPPGSYQYRFIADGVEMPDPDVKEQVPDGRGGYATPLLVKPKRPQAETEVVKIIFSLDRPEAEDVRVTGSWLNWDPEGIKMEKSESGTWSTTVKLKPGNYTYKFYIDGKWVADPDVEARVSDGKGGWATPFAAYSRKGEYTPIRFSLDRPEAEDVRVSGNWLNWDGEGIRMARDKDGVWSITVPLKPGTYYYKFYIDGKWVADPDEPERAVSDGKGGYMTKFVVHPRRKAEKFAFKASVEKERQGVSGLLDYNRVDGLLLGLKASNTKNVFPMPRFKLEGGYTYKRKRWFYSFEVEQPLLPPFRLSAGGSIYDKTESEDQELISDIENLLVASFLKQDYRDYFDLRGVAGFVALRPWKNHIIKLAYSENEYRPLETRAHTSLFFRKDRDFRPNPRNSVQICTDPLTGKRICDKIDVHSLVLSYELDTRDDQDTPMNGMLLRFSTEWAREGWGSDYSYERYSGDIRHYVPVSPQQLVSFRIKAGLLDISNYCPACSGTLRPCPPELQYFFPKQFAVGGIGTLPGYGYKQFQGTHMMLVNFEYVYSFNDGMAIVFFSDAGDASGAVPRSRWDRDKIWDTMKFKVDTGLALRHEESGDYSFTIGIAKGITKLYDKDGRPVIVIVRASRPF